MMGMYKNIQDILNVVWNDEQLNRLLHYRPKRLSPQKLDPLDPLLPNILDVDEDWTIRNNVIKLTPKESDLTEMESCKLFVYLGDSIANRTNPLYANQSVIFDVLCPADFENGDFRSSRIGDRLNELFALTYVTGIGKIDFARRRVLARFPNPYIGYRYEYETVEFKK